MKRLLAIALLAALPLAASATDKSYNFAEIGYINFNDAAEGTYLRGNYDLGKSNVYLTSTVASADVRDENLTLRATDYGVGYHFRLSERVDVIGEAARGSFDVGSVRDRGYRASIGTRFDITDAVEGLAQFNHYNGEDFLAENTGTVTALYKFGSRWGVSATAEANGAGNDIYSVGFSAAF